MQISLPDSWTTIHTWAHLATHMKVGRVKDPQVTLSSFVSILSSAHMPYHRYQQMYVSYRHVSYWHFYNMCHIMSRLHIYQLTFLYGVGEDGASRRGCQAGDCSWDCNPTFASVKELDTVQETLGSFSSCVCGDKRSVFWMRCHDLSIQLCGDKTAYFKPKHDLSWP